jgi:hypothetical protein
VLIKAQLVMGQMIGTRRSLFVVAVFVCSQEKRFLCPPLRNKEDYSARNKNDKNKNTRLTLPNDLLRILIVL